MTLVPTGIFNVCLPQPEPAASAGRSKAVHRVAGVSVENVMRVPRVQGDHLPARRRQFFIQGCYVSDGQGD
ncbi:hypothetical protein RDSD_000021 [Oleidesulfovibrio alaskensis]|jgi:hypothetical protein